MSESREIKAGDIVRLKSGGPQMTVRFNHAPRVTCEWFAGDEPRSNTYEECQLVHSGVKRLPVDVAEPIWGKPVTMTVG